MQDVAQLRQWLDECDAPRLVAGEHQDEAEVAASWGSRRVTSAEATADEGGLGRDRCARD